VAQITNVHFDGPDENIDQHDEIGKREGAVFCGVTRGSVWGKTLRKDPDAPAASPIFSGEKAEFFLGNTVCTIYPDGNGSGEQVAKLDAAMEELAGSLTG
jgi:hypothetical protein